MTIPTRIGRLRGADSAGGGVDWPAACPSWPAGAWAPPWLPKVQSDCSIVPAGRSYGVVASVDGRGAVTRHAPEDGARAVRLPAQGAVPLAHSYRLDDAPAFERFFLVTGGSPFEVEPVLDALRRLAAEGGARTGAPALPPGLAWSDFVLEKAP